MQQAVLRAMDLPSGTRDPGAVKGKMGTSPPSRLADEWSRVGVVLRTQPAQRWVPAVVQLRGRDEEEMAQRREGTRVNRAGEGAAQLQRLVLGGALWGPNSVGSGEG